jgi:hypothetical protein
VYGEVNNPSIHGFITSTTGASDPATPVKGKGKKNRG